jgi:serine/threonine protein kinase
MAAHASPNHPLPDPPAAEPPDAPPLGAGDTLAQYTIRCKLGRGGMGAVYLARDNQLRRDVALKVMLPRFAADWECRERFLREARAAAAVASDHVVTIHQVGLDRDTPFIAMQCLQGVPLDRYLAAGLPPAAEVLRIGREAAAGLAAAHALGVIHRDVKPANIWLEAPAGRVKLLDFGLAKPAGDEPSLTGVGTLVGTPQYMAPEQARGNPVDHRADLFALGCVLYELATGRPPFVGPTTVAVLTAVTTDTPPPVAQLNPRTPAGLAQLIEQLMAKDPAARPASAEAVIERLAAIEAGLPAAAARPATPPPARAAAGAETVGDAPTKMAAGQRKKSAVPLPLVLAAPARAVAGGVLIPV